MEYFCEFLVVGSGISASCCVDELLSYDLSKNIIMISPCSNIKVISELTRISKILDEVKIGEVVHDCYYSKSKHFLFLQDSIRNVETSNNCVKTKIGNKINYNKLILCSGSSPRRLNLDSPFVYYLRDIDSFESVRDKVSKSKCVCVVGNGGIAMEVVYEMRDCEVVWVVKQSYPGSKFFDMETSDYFESVKNLYLGQRKAVRLYSSKDITKSQFLNKVSDDYGSALGPEWNKYYDMAGSNVECSSYPSNLRLHLNSEVSTVRKGQEHALEVELNNGNTFECDLIIAAVGIIPSTKYLLSNENGIILNDEFAIIVDNNLRSSIPNVFAAGDCCYLKMPKTEKINLWFQMNLWTQAKHMGVYAAQCAYKFQQNIPIYFEVFGHISYFFGYKVCFFGLYNAQGLEDGSYKKYFRVNNKEYIRLIILNGRIVGAVLIGNTEMEETIENLILSELDISHIGENILNPDVDICDYFD